MPVGPYETFDQCVIGIMNKEGVDELSARKICGKMEAQSAASFLKALASAKVAVGSAETFEQGGQKYAKLFLISPKVNSNYWETPADTIAAFARTFIGMPFVSDDTGVTGAAFDHLGLQPPFNRPVEEILQRQEKPDVKAGTIIDVTFDPATAEAFAIVRFENTAHGNKVYEDLQKGEAIYTSPAITGFAEVLPGGRLRYREWWGVHLARVKNPAYGVMVASLKQTCEGPEKKCLQMLASAAAHVGSFCPKTGSITMNSSVKVASTTPRQKMAADDSANATDVKQLQQQVKELTEQVASLTKERDSYKAQAQTASDLGKKFDELSAKYAKIEEGERTKIATEIVDMKIEAELTPKEKRETEIASLAKLDLASLQAEKANITPFVQKIKSLASSVKDGNVAGGIMHYGSTRGNVVRTVRQVETASEHAGDDASGGQPGIRTLADVQDIVGWRSA